MTKRKWCHPDCYWCAKDSLPRDEMTLADAAAALDLRRATLQQQIKKGKLTARMIGPLWAVKASEVSRYGRENKRF